MSKLTNPRYAGRGRLNRWKSTWVQKYDDETGETYDVKEQHLRPYDQTLPMAPDVEPMLVPADLFDRVQRKLEQRRQFLGRSDRSKHPQDSTILQGGIVRCAHCGRAMARTWRHDSKRHANDPVPYYRCSTLSKHLATPCTVHMIPAHEVDALVVRLLATALTDPDYTLKLADAADAKLTRAAADMEIIGTRLESYRARMDEIDAAMKRYRRVLTALDPTQDADDVAEYQAKIERLEAERDRLTAEAAAATPQHALATDRHRMLESLRAGKLLLGFQYEGQWQYVREMKVWDARRMLGLPSLGELLNADRVERGLDKLPDIEAELEARSHFRDPAYDADSEEIGDVDTRPSDTWSMADVARLLLARYMPRSEVRKLLRRLDAVVEISRPRPKAERVANGLTPVDERVSLLLMQENGAEGAAGLRLRSSGVANGTKLAMPTISTPAAHRSG